MTYPYSDLRSYLQGLDDQGLLVHVEERINKDTELVPLVRLQFRGLPEHQRKGFLFHNVTDSSGRSFDASVAIATFAASREIYSAALGAKDDLAGAWRQALANPIQPVVVDDGACKERKVGGQELAATLGIDDFPHPVSTPGFDPAPFLTAGCWVTRDVEDGSYNVGTYRGMIKGPTSIGLQMDTPSQHIAIHLAKARRAGKALEVAIVLGTVPAVALASVQKLPYGVSEYGLAGGILGRPLELVMAETVDIAVPAHAEIVIEGIIDPTVVEDEGPFGEASGYMGPRTRSPVVDVRAITHRVRPIVQAFISEFPPSESTLMRKIGFENVYLRFLKDSCNIASVSRVVFYEAASCNMIIVVQLDHPTAGQAWQALYATAGYEPSMGKLIIAVDSDIEPDNLSALLWALSYRVQPARDVKVLDGRVARLDPSSPPPPEGGTPPSSALLVDATRSGPYPPTSLPGRQYMEAAIERWNSLDLPALGLEDPWFGSEFGGWSEQNRQEALLAVAGRYLETGSRLSQTKGPVK